MDGFNDGFDGPTLDELIEQQTPEVKQAVEDIIEEAGTSDADWAVLEAAGKLLAEARTYSDGLIDL